MPATAIDLHVFRYQEFTPDRLALLLSYLPEDEVRQTDKMSGDRADCFIAERGMMREILAKQLQQAPQSLEFNRSDLGKPKLASDNNIQFNLSHCKDLFVLAVLEGAEIGVDIERTQRSNNLERIAMHYFSQEEVDYLMAESRQFEHRFAELWTCKESIGKLLGTGINKTFLKNVTKVIQGNVSPNLDWLEYPVVCCSYEQAGHLLSIACAGLEMPTINILDKGWHKI